MGIYDALERQTISEWPPGPASDFWYGPTSSHGVEVTPDSSLQLTAVWRAVNLLSSAVGTLPAKLYQRRAGVAGGRDELRDDPLHYLLRWQPNSWQPAVDFFEMMQGHVLLRGNSFSQVKRTPLGAATALVPWHPDRTKIKILPSGRLRYMLKRPHREDLVVPQEDMLHIRGPGGNGIVGYSVIALHAESLGMTFAAQAYGARFFDNNASPSGILSHPGKLKDATRKNIENSWKAGYGGKRQHSMALVEDGMTWTQVGVPPEEAQFLETRNFQVSEIARMFGVPPHMLMQMEKATFSNIEHQGLEFATYSVRPWLIRWEQTMKMVLLPGQRERTIEFLMDAILRGDSAARAESNATRFMNGTLSIDEWRAGENQNPLPDGQGEGYFVPMNLIRVEDANEGLPDQAVDTGLDDDDDDRAWYPPGRWEQNYLSTRGVNIAVLSPGQLRGVASRHRQLRSFQRLLLKAATRVVSREVEAVQRAVIATDGEPGPLAIRLEELYGGFAKVVLKELGPVLQAYAEVVYGLASHEVGADPEMTPNAEEFVRDYSTNMATRYVLSSEGQLSSVIRKAQVEQSGGSDAEKEAVAAAVLLRAAEWDKKRASKVARREAAQANGAVSVNAYDEAGIAEVVWVTVGENCPLCKAMDGRTVATGSDFLAKGSTLEAEGSSPLTSRRGVAHPPLHPPSCDCMIAAKS